MAVTFVDPQRGGEARGPAMKLIEDIRNIFAPRASAIAYDPETDPLIMAMQAQRRKVSTEACQIRRESRRERRPQGSELSFEELFGRECDGTADE